MRGTKKYNPKSFQYGYELELADNDRSIQIPEEWGKWEFCEEDIVNTMPPYRGIAVDPDGINPPVGGEINTMPTQGWEDQVDRILNIADLFPVKTITHLTWGGIHVHVPKLFKDIKALRKLMRYIQANSDDTISYCNQFQYHPDMDKTKTAKKYLKYDGGKVMPEWLVDNICSATNFGEFLDYHIRGKDKKSRIIPQRYHINTYALKHNGTIEFRVFRSTLDREELEGKFKFVQDFMDAALNDGPSVRELIEKNNYKMPPMLPFDLELHQGWENTKKKVYDYRNASASNVKRKNRGYRKPNNI